MIYIFYIKYRQLCVDYLWLIKKINKNQTELSIKTHDFNVPNDHISHFVVEFNEECYPILRIKENKKKGDRPSYPICSMLKLLVYAKIGPY